MKRFRPLWLLATGALAGCNRTHVTAPSRDAGTARADVERVRAIAVVPPPGPSEDGSEIDVPLRWIHLLEEPAPTGSTPYAVVGATVPCGFVPRYVVSERGELVVRLRMRAQRRPPDGGACTVGAPVVELVSLSQLRLGDWQVVDAVPHAAGDPPMPTPRTLHVVADDPALRPAAERWTRPCARTSDCTSGGVCARAGAASICMPAMDPWLHLGRSCPGGTHPIEVRAVDAREGGAWQACVAACDTAGCACSTSSTSFG